MSDIVLSPGVRSNLLQLQQTSNLITQTQTRLATGKKVNSALDNPINFFTAQGLSVRANDLNSLLDAMSNGINTIQAANNGISAITKLVQSMQALTSQAQQTADTTVRATLASQFELVADSDRSARRRLRLQWHQSARRQRSYDHDEPRRDFECGRLIVQRHYGRRPGDQRFAERLGGHC